MLVMADMEFLAIQEGIISAIKDMCNFRYNGRKMSVNRLATFSGVSRSGLLSIISGATDSIGIKTLWKLCNVSGISLSDFFADIEDEAKLEEKSGSEPSSLADLSLDNTYINDNYKALNKAVKEFMKGKNNAELQNRYREDAIIACKQISGYLTALKDLNIISEKANTQLQNEVSITMDKICNNSGSNLQAELLKLLKEDNES